MRKKGINTAGLLRFAQHLENKQFNKEYKGATLIYSKDGINLILGINGVYQEILPFVVQELPYVFKQWFISRTGFITYVPEPGLMNQYAVLEFFRLPVKPMLHIFTLNRQDVKRYGGKIIHKDSTPKDVAENIYCFLESYKLASKRENMIFTRRVLVEKCIATKTNIKNI